MENTGSEPLDAVLSAKCDLGPGHPQELEVIFRDQRGSIVEPEFIYPLGKEPSGTQWYSGWDQPNGEWTLRGAGTQIAVVNAFPKDQVTRCLLNWTAKADYRVTLALWSAKRAIAPGQVLRLEADYEIRKYGS